MFGFSYASSVGRLNANPGKPFRGPGRGSLTCAPVIRSTACHARRRQTFSRWTSVFGSTQSFLSGIRLHKARAASLSLANRVDSLNLTTRSSRARFAASLVRYGLPHRSAATQAGLTQALDRCRKVPVCRTKANRRATRVVALLNSGARYARTEANLYESKRESLVVAFDNACAYQFVRCAGR